MTFRPLRSASYRFTRLLRGVRNRSHRLRGRRLYARFVAAGDLCFDVGANVGDRTAILLALGATVVAVEPQEPCLHKLRRRFEDNPRVHLVGSALGRAAGTATLRISDASTLSSMSDSWISSVTSSGRFADHRWDKTAEVEVTTLDALIAEYGTPAFCKVDVEGYELEVLRGLSRPVRTVSFEFTPENLDPAVGCVRHLEALGLRAFNLSLGESLRLELERWVGAEAMIGLLRSRRSSPTFGDVYASLSEALNPS